MQGRPALYCAVYARSEAAAAADIFAAHLPCPHLLEWNLFNNGPAVGLAAPSTRGVYGAGIAVDLDGILLHDAESGGRPGTPYLVARQHPLKLIATGRPERSRAETVGELRRWGVRWARLEMLPDQIELTPESAAAHKARHYAASGCGFFVESDPAQAELIHLATRKPVVCPRAGRVWQ